MIDKKKPRVYFMCYKFDIESEIYPIHIKIGITGDIQKRVRQIQTPSLPYLVTALNCDSIYQARLIEQYIFKILTKYNNRNEWFILRNKQDFEDFKIKIDAFLNFIENILPLEFKQINIKKI